MRRGRVGEGGPGEQKAAGRRPVVHGAAYEVPHLAQALRLVDEHRPLTLQQTGRVSLGYGHLGGVIETMHRLGALQRGSGLPNSVWTRTTPRNSPFRQLQIACSAKCGWPISTSPR